MTLRVQALHTLGLPHKLLSSWLSDEEMNILCIASGDSIL